MLGDGTLLVPNDNFLIYALDRDTGEKRRDFLGNELMWSLPAVNPRTGRIFAGSQYMLWKNVFVYDAGSGKALWTNGALVLGGLENDFVPDAQRSVSREGDDAVSADLLEVRGRGKGAAYPAGCLTMARTKRTAQ